MTSDPNRFMEEPLNSTTFSALAGELEEEHGAKGARNVAVDEESLTVRRLRARVEQLEADNVLLEEQLRQLHRVKTISDLLSGVAHDLSGALTGIVWCAEAVRRRLGQEDRNLDEGLLDFVAAADYARKLARRLVSVGRKRETRFERLRLHAVLDDAVKLIEILCPRNIRLTTELAAVNAVVWGNPDELQQVLVNLASNAFDAVGEAPGSVHLELSEASAPVRDDARRWVLLRVRDTGHGMSPDILERAFEPFFTTKGAHDGNGLGLVVVRSIVERHRGRVSATSAPDRGTTIEVLIPQSD